MKRLKEELLRKFLLFIFFIDFEQRFLQALTRCFARVRCIGFVAISLSFHKEMAKEREPKALMPFGNPQRANVASLSLRSCLHKVIQLQPLYWRFKEKRQYGSRTHDASAKTFAFYYAPCGRKKWNKNGFLPLPLVVASRRAMHKKWNVFLLFCFEERQYQGSSKRERLGSLSWLLLCWTTKK